MGQPVYTSLVQCFFALSQVTFRYSINSQILCIVFVFLMKSNFTFWIQQLNKKISISFAKIISQLKARKHASKAALQNFDCLLVECDGML